MVKQEQPSVKQEQLSAKQEQLSAKQEPLLVKQEPPSSAKGEQLSAKQEPPSSVKGEKQQMLQQFQMYGQNGQAPQIDLPDDLFTEQAEKRVSVGLIVNEIVSSSDLTADPDRIKARVEALAEGYAEPAQVVSYYYSNPEQLQQIEMAVLEDQVVDHILEQAAVEKVSTNYQDALSGAAVAPEPSVDETSDTQKSDEDS